jgi:hypothetical protein
LSLSSKTESSSTETASPASEIDMRMNIPKIVVAIRAIMVPRQEERRFLKKLIRRVCLQK